MTVARVGGRSEARQAPATDRLRGDVARQPAAAVSGTRRRTGAPGPPSPAGRRRWTASGKRPFNLEHPAPATPTPSLRPGTLGDAEDNACPPKRRESCRHGPRADRIARDHPPPYLTYAQAMLRSAGDRRSGSDASLSCEPRTSAPYRTSRAGVGPRKGAYASPSLHPNVSIRPTAQQRGRVAERAPERRAERSARQGTTTNRESIKHEQEARLVACEEAKGVRRPD